MKTKAVTPMKPFLRVLQGETLSPPPLWLMRQAGRYLPEYRAVRARAGSFLDLCYDPALATEVTLQPIQRFGFDAAILFSDILVIPHALGQKLSFVEGEGPRLAPLDLNRLDVLRPASVPFFLEPVFETVRRVKERLAPEVALIGFCGGPWTVATYMIAGQGGDDQRAAKEAFFKRPDAVLHLIDLLIEASVIYLNAQADAGADALQIFESFAGSLDEKAFMDLAIAPVRRIVQGVRARHPGIPIIGFPKGAGAFLPLYARETGVSALGLDWQVPLSFARDHVQNLVPCQGNLDPLRLLAGGDALETGVESILSTLAGKPFVFNLGHGILPDTPLAHVARLVDKVRGS